MIELLDHNKDTYNRLCLFMQENSKCALIQATGTGKSYIAGKYIEEHANTALIIVPTNAIADAWSDLFSDSENIDIVTYQAFAREPNNYLDYDLIIADEMHHLGSEVWGKKFVETYLQSENHKIIGLTATEIRYLDNSRDMSEEIFDNLRIDGCDLPTAINNGIFPTFKYVSALYCDEKDFDEWKERAGKIKDIKTQKELKGRLDVCIKNMVSVKQAVDENLTDDYKKIIVFLNNVESKETALEMFKDVFPNASFYDVDYSKSRNENTSQIDSFKADKNRAVLFAVDMLNEGIHIKGTDCVIMFRKTISPQVYLQQLGRALASGADKTPIIFDFVSNYRNVHLRPNFPTRENIGTPIIELWNRKTIKNKIIIKNYVSQTQDILFEINEILIRKWTEEEEKFLKENSDKMSYSEMAEKLNRSKEAIMDRCYRLGIYAVSIAKARYYTRDEIDFIKQNYENMSHDEIARSINRTKASVQYKISQLGLYKTKTQKILQLDYWLNVINCFQSVRQAIENNNFSVTNGTKRIYECLSGNKEDYHGYKWMYEEDYMKMIAESEEKSNE